MPWLFGLSASLGAALLFSAEPMVAKAILPLLGGAPAVWTTCVASFQAALLVGYAFAHATTARLGVRRQAVVQLALLGVALAFLPLAAVGEATRPPPSDADPTAWLFALLAATVGLPFVAVSTVAPTLQRWYAETGRRDASDPYFLYAASNAGSLAALVAYPLAIEPRLSLAGQGRVWSIGFVVLVALMLACASAVWRSRGTSPGRSSRRRARCDRLEAAAPLGGAGGRAVEPDAGRDDLPDDRHRTRAPAVGGPPGAVPAVVHPDLRPSSGAARVVDPALPVAAMLLAPALAVGLVQPIWIPLHLLATFLAAMVCHGELARDRPPARALTGFYLAAATGGVVGGLFNALVAPVIFDRVAEYPLALILSCLAVPGVRLGPRARRARRRSRRSSSR